MASLESAEEQWGREVSSALSRIPWRLQTIRGRRDGKADRDDRWQHVRAGGNHYAPEKIQATPTCAAEKTLAMDSIQYRAIRKKFYPEDPAGFLIELGFEGSDGTLKTRARRFENGDLPIPKRVCADGVADGSMEIAGRSIGPMGCMNFLNGRKSFSIDVSPAGEFGYMPVGLLENSGCGGEDV